MDKVILQVKNMYKNFGSTIALNDVSFDLKCGEVRGLIGENGSGKSTVSSIIAGMQSASKGEMIFKGEQWNPSSTIYAKAKGIGMIVQEAGTIGNISVAENIFLGHENNFKTGIIIDKKKMLKEAQQHLDNLGLTKIKAYTRTETLDMQDRKLIEVARCLYFNPEILIIDETTTALSRDGREFLYKMIANLKAAGKSVLLISHDLDEMMEYCDNLTVLRDGVIIGTLEKQDYNPDVIRRMMVGREVKGDYYRSDYDGYSDEVVLKADCVTTLHDLLCFSLELHKGEILGIGGLSQCGMRTVGQAVFGIEKVLDGKVINNLTNKEIKNPNDAVKNKMAYVSKNRDMESLGLSGTIRENISSTGYKKNKGFGPLISGKKEKAYVDKQIEDLLIKCSGRDQIVNTLSGGNKQKVVFGKWVAYDAEILILDCPTRGVDVGVKAAMYDLIYNMKKAGKSIILISEELQELIGMSDRILIMKDGEIACESKREQNLSEHDYIKYMI